MAERLKQEAARRLRPVSLVAKMMNSATGDSWTTETCPEMWTGAEKRDPYEGSPANITGHLVWCSNLACARVGIMLDPVTMKPKIIP
jgi:hypothetical protein